MILDEVFDKISIESVPDCDKEIRDKVNDSYKMDLKI